jgi:hypothetical protein
MGSIGRMLSISLREGALACDLPRAREGSVLTRSALGSQDGEKDERENRPTASTRFTPNDSGKAYRAQSPSITTSSPFPGGILPSATFCAKTVWIPAMPPVMKGLLPIG